MSDKTVPTWVPTTRLRIVRDNSWMSFSSDFRRPDILQQAWQSEDGAIEWHDVEVVSMDEVQAAKGKA